MTVFSFLMQSADTSSTSGGNKLNKKLDLHYFGTYASTRFAAS